MPKRYHISEEQVTEIKNARIKNKDKNVEKRLKALLLHAQGEKRPAIATKTGFVESYISELVSKYCNKGLSAIAENNYPGNHRNLSFTEEEALLAPFKKKAEAGEIVEVSEIKLAYEKATGKSFGDNNRGQIYRVLQRHGWRKIMPRSKHPNKADDEAIEASKKLTIPTELQWQIITMEGISD
jgi:transposase